MGLAPLTVAYLALGTAAAGTALTAYGQYASSEAQNKQAEFQSKVAANNAATAEMEAKYAEQQGEKNAEAQRRKTAVMIGAQRARMGSSGAVADTGSFLDIELDTAKMGELDALALREEGQLAAWRARTQGANYTAQSQLYGMSKSNSFLAAGGTLLSGAGQVGMGYYSTMKTKK